MQQKRQRSRSRGQSRDYMPTLGERQLALSNGQPPRGQEIINVQFQGRRLQEWSVQEILIKSQTVKRCSSNSFCHFIPRHNTTLHPTAQHPTWHGARINTLSTTHHPSHSPHIHLFPTSTAPPPPYPLSTRYPPHPPLAPTIPPPHPHAHNLPTPLLVRQHTPTLPRLTPRTTLALSSHPPHHHTPRRRNGACAHHHHRRRRSRRRPPPPHHHHDLLQWLQ